MVRLKHRYLLIDILYPQRVSVASVTALIGKNDFIEFHAPSPSRFDERALARMIRDHVGELFGDYGAGKIAGSLKSMFSPTCRFHFISDD
jgi:ribonuclease P/MRP protein subunit POP5